MAENSALVFCKILLREDLDKICRCCLSPKPLTSIFEIIYEGTPLTDIFFTVFGSQLDPEDNLPKKVCEICIGEILRSYFFKKRYEASEVALQNLIPIKIEDDDSETAEVNNVEELGDTQLTEETVPDCNESEGCNNTEESEVCDITEESEICNNTEESETCNNIEESKTCNNTEGNLKQTSTIMIQTQSKKFKCSCGETFALKLEFRQHREETGHQLPRNHPCKICGKLYTVHSLWAHTRTHDVVKRYSCNYCTMRFAYSGNLKRHIRQHTGEKRFLCEFCGKSFIQQDCLTSHRRIHTGEKPYLCNVCGKTFRDKLTCNAHVRSHNRDKSPVSNLSKKRDSTKIPCVECGKICYSQLSYKLHLYNKHALGEEPTGEHGEQQCEICQNYYASKTSLSFHMLTHNGERRFLCNECGKRFRTRALLGSHYLVHSHEKSLSCEFCDKKFSRQQSLQTHRYVHTGERPYACALCPQKFRQSSHLVSHMKVHTGERPFVCKFCDKSFPLKGNYVIHVRKHTGEKPYECDVCGDRFHDSGSLKKHKQRKH